MIDFILRGCLLLSLVPLPYRLFVKRTAPLLERLLQGLIAPAAVVAVLEIVRHILSAPFWDRNATRLVGTFCLRYGLPLYPSAHTGAVQSMNYPPLAAIAFLPAALATTPTQALLLGDTLTALYFFLPAFLLFKQAAKTPLSPTDVAATCLAFVFGVLKCAPLAYSGLRIHADAPALGFAALGMYFLEKSTSEENTRALWFSALGIALSIWTKQMIIPLAVLLPAWIFFTQGPRRAGTYLLALALWGVGMLGLFLIWISPADLFLNLFYISNKPWVGTFLHRTFAATKELWSYSFVFLVLVGLFGFGTLKKKESWMRTRWSLFGLIGIGMAPLAIISRGKSGLDVNTLSFSLYFLAIAGLLALQDGLRAPRVIQRGAQTAMCLALAFFTLGVGRPLLQWGLSPLVHILPHNPQQIAYAYARAHPDEVYFPWNPLSNLMAEKKLYHFEGALEDWAWAGRPIDQQRFETFIPSHLRWIAFDERNEFTHETTRHYLPAFTEPTTLPELPHWLVYQRPA